MQVETKHALPDNLLTDADVARLTGRARKTIQKDRLRGGEDCIPFIRLGRLVRYRQSDVAEFISRHPTLRSTSESTASRGTGRITPAPSARRL
jgi:predicted DNA-binding transcriptional regulator AlpA